jgi:hypothetical protein
MLRIFIGGVFVTVCVYSLLGQDSHPKTQGDKPSPAWAPKDAEAIADVYSLSLAQLSNDRQHVRLLAPIYEMKVKNGEREVVTEVPVTKTRMTISNGREIEETFTETQLVTEIQTFEYETIEVIGHKQLEISVEVVSATELSSKSVSLVELRRRLQTSAKVFLITDEDIRASGSFRLDPFYADVMKPETIVLVVPAQALNDAPIHYYDSEGSKSEAGKSPHSLGN